MIRIYRHPTRLKTRATTNYLLIRLCQSVHSSSSGDTRWLNEKIDIALNILQQPRDNQSFYRVLVTCISWPIERYGLREFFNDEGRLIRRTAIWCQTIFGLITEYVSSNSNSGSSVISDGISSVRAIWSRMVTENYYNFQNNHHEDY